MCAGFVHISQESVIRELFAIEKRVVAESLQPVYKSNRQKPETLVLFSDRQVPV